MNKKIGLAVLAALVFFSHAPGNWYCEAGKPQIPDMHNSQNSIDYYGCYRANKAQGAAPKVVELEDGGTFRLLSGDGRQLSGTYSWEASGQRVRFFAEGAEVFRFFVGEGFLRAEQGMPGEGDMLFLQERDAACWQDE